MSSHLSLPRQKSPPRCGVWARQLPLEGCLRHPTALAGTHDTWLDSTPSQANPPYYSAKICTQGTSSLGFRICSSGFRTCSQELGDQI